MNNNKYLLAAIVGGVVFFILGWVIYGMMLMDFMAQNSGSATGVAKTEAEMDGSAFGSIILSNLASGFLFAAILSWANAGSAAAGAKVGALVGLLMAISVDFIMYGTSNIMNLTYVMVDIVVWTIMATIAGAVIGSVLGSGQAKAAS
jgi:hypothetical protein